MAWDIQGFLNNFKEGFDTGREKKKLEKQQFDEAEKSSLEWVKSLSEAQQQKEIRDHGNLMDAREQERKDQLHQIKLAQEEAKLEKIKNPPAPTTSPTETPTKAPAETKPEEANPKKDIFSLLEQLLGGRQPAQAAPEPTAPTPTMEPQGVGDTAGILESYGPELSAKLEKDLPTLKAAAIKWGMPLEQLLAQWWQESSFGTNPNIKKENWAGALGDFQIRDTFTDPNNPTYPAFKDLSIAPDDRLDLEKSADFAGKHYRRLSDHYNPDQAITSYFGDKSYLDQINKVAQTPQIQSIIDYLNGGR